MSTVEETKALHAAYEEARRRVITYACEKLPLPLTGFKVGYIGNCDCRFDDRLYILWFEGAIVESRLPSGRYVKVTNIRETRTNPCTDADTFIEIMTRGIDGFAQAIAEGRYRVMTRTYYGREWHEKDEWDVKYWRERYGNLARPAAAS